MVAEITPTTIRTLNVETREENEIRNDFVFALTGYHADYEFLRDLGIELDPDTRKPRIDLDTFESNIPGIYLAGVVIAGVETNKVFIENGRFHGKQLVAAMHKTLGYESETVAKVRS